MWGYGPTTGVLCMVNPYDILLPTDIYELAQYHIMITARLDRIWTEYAGFAMNKRFLPQTDLIFPILFSELDFYEVLLARVRVHLPEEILRELNYDEEI
jgi:hypothetical protein